MIAEKENIKKIIEYFNKIKGKLVFTLEEYYTEKIVRSPGGYDHLGCKPDIVMKVPDKYKVRVRELRINEDNITDILDNPNDIYYTREDAHWAMLNKQQEHKQKE